MDYWSSSDAQAWANANIIRNAEEARPQDQGPTRGAGLSQYACAPLLGVSRTYLADVECGRRNASLAALDSIARGLDVSLEELLRGV
ncbi:helix-turn-helix domain-containing protein [Gordonibacter sp. RACS_AR68]|uniref:helix-turn-helix domain-containing protein n=1 Tax=Gordonibacter sp. RACS_AR68 TaxID=2872005 RepID=UPI00345EAC0F